MAVSEPSEARRNTFVSLRLDPEEVERINQKMEEVGMHNRSAYIRKMALDGYCIKLDFSELHELMRLLSICSNNLNQYAKRANTDGSIYREDIEDLRTRFDDLFRAGTRIVQTIEDLA